MLNPFFQQGSREEQSLIQDLINEQLRIYGVEIYYLPRKYITEKTIIREVIESKFDDAHPIEAYVDNFEGYGDNTNILTKFGIQATNEITLIISKERFEEYISPLIKNQPNIKLSTRPKEGDLLYFPLGDRLFEIKYVEHEKPFYQLQKTYVYELRCELFRYEDEVIDTGVDEIDDVLDATTGADGGEIYVGKTQSLTLIGVGVTATAITSLTSGAIRFISVTNRGSGYTSIPNVAISSAPTGGITGIATAEMISGIVVCNENVNPNARSVQAVRLINPGSGYLVPPGVRFIGGGGSGAAATVSIAQTGAIGIVTITNGGSGYSTAPTVTFSTPKHVGAAATAIIGSPVGTGVSVISAVISIGASSFLFPGGTTGGVFYKSAPTVTFGLPSGNGNTATAVATMGNYSTTGGTIQSIAITSEGKFYNPASPPIVTISSPGTSLASATIGIAGSSVNPSTLVFASRGRAYRTAPTVAITTTSGQSAPTIVAIGIATIHPITGIVTDIGFDNSLPWCVGTSATIGAGYNGAPTLTFSGSPSPVQATATANVSVAGTVSSISIGNSGFGYENGQTATVSIASPTGANEAFRALGIATIRYNSVKTTGTIGISSNTITGISTSNIIIGDRVRLSVGHSDYYNFIPSDTYVSGIGLSELSISKLSSNVGIATSVFEFGIDKCGIVTGIAVTYGGGGYLSPPTITISNNVSEKNYVEIIPGISTATGITSISSSGIVTSILITDSGYGYILTPTVTISSPYSSGIGTFLFNEVITGNRSGTTARVRKWNAVSSTLEISNMNGVFRIGETVVGQESGASYEIRFVDSSTTKDGYSENDIIELEADEIINFNESNPFGMP